MSSRTELQFKVLEMERYRYRRQKEKEAFLRPAYQGTSAECKDRTQVQLHEFDYLK
jgi:hypothetical protein